MRAFQSQGAPPSTAVEVRRFLEDIGRRLDLQQPALALGLDERAPEPALRDAYFRLFGQVCALRLRDELGAAEQALAVDVALRLDAAYQRALAISRGAEETTGESQRDRIERANEAFRTGRYFDARDRYGEAALADPSDAEAHFGLARATIALARTPEAIDRSVVEGAFRKAIELAPEEPEYALAFARYWRLLGERREALRCYTLVAELSPDHPEAVRELQRLRDPSSRPSTSPRARR